MPEEDGGSRAAPVARAQGGRQDRKKTTGRGWLPPLDPSRN